MQYVGEQAFDLIVVNVTASTPVTSDPVPTPWGGAGSPLTLTPGPNDFLVPRSIFLNSTIGRSVVEGVNMSDPDGSWFSTPLLGSEEYGAMVGLIGYDLGGELPLAALSCYWQDRALPYYGYDSPRSGSVCLPFAQGTRTSNPDFVQVYVDNNNAGSVNGTLNAGGLPSDPSLESTAVAGAALQSILTVNITNSTDGYGNPLGPVPSLDLLLAGLLDNSSGGVNGTLVNVTSSLGLLGLDSVVTSALPDSSVIISGLYGPPGAVQTTSGHGCSWLGCVYQALSGAYDWLVDGIEYFVSGAWITGAIAWFVSLPARAEQLGFDFIEDYLAGWCTAYWVLTHLPQVGAILLRAVLSAMSWLGTQVIEKLLNPVIQWLTGGARSYFVGLNNSFALAYADTASGKPVSRSHANAFWAAFSGSVFLGATLIAGIIEVAVLIVSTLAIGGGFIVGIVFLLLAKGVSGILGTTAGVPELSTWGESGIKAVWAFANLSLLPQQINQVLIATWFQLAADLAGSLGIAVPILLMSAGAGQPIIAPLVTAISAVIALTADFVASVYHLTWVAWIGIVAGVMGVGLGIYSTITGEVLELRVMTAVGGALSALAVLSGAALVSRYG